MRLTTVIILAFLVQVSAATKAQKISYTKRSTTLKEVFRQIKLQTGFNVLYEKKSFDNTPKIDVDFKNVELEEVLKTLSKNNSLEYEVDERNIAIQKSSGNFLEKAAEVLSSFFVNIDVYGKIVDENGSSLGGATITIKSTGRGVSAKADGNFSISNAEEGTILLLTV